MTAAQINEAFDRFNARADDIATDAICGLPYDELIVACRSLYDDIAELLRHVNTRREIVNANALRRTVYSLSGGSSAIAPPIGTVRQACSDIAALEEKLIATLRRPSGDRQPDLNRPFYAR